MRAPAVLVVDDDDFVRNLLVRQLAAIGIGDVAGAANGGDAVRLLQEHRFGVIIFDLLMPGMDGVEFLRYVADSSPAAALILVSSQEPRVVRGVAQLVQARGLELLGSLQKPVSTEQLRLLLGKTVSAAAAPEKSPAEPVNPEELKAAIDAGEIEVYVQPKVATRDRRLAGAEALARWFRDGRPVSPERFVPVAEAHGLIDALTGLVVRRALESCGEWARQGLRISISINISAASLPRLDLPEVLTELAAGYGVEPQQIVLEVTESGLVRDHAVALDVLTRLRLRAFGLSLDDFGTGYSSLKQLERMPFTELKIDRGFIARLLEDRESARIVESSIKLARDLGLVSVAEGVETEPQLERLARLGCDLAQGYLVARPFPRSELVGWARRHRVAG